jgi:hypothetical protein
VRTSIVVQWLFLSVAHIARTMLQLIAVMRITSLSFEYCRLCRVHPDSVGIKSGNVWDGSAFLNLGSNAGTKDNSVADGSR